MMNISKETHIEIAQEINSYRGCAWLKWAVLSFLIFVTATSVQLNQAIYTGRNLYFTCFSENYLSVAHRESKS